MSEGFHVMKCNGNIVYSQLHSLVDIELKVKKGLNKNTHFYNCSLIAWKLIID